MTSEDHTSILSPADLAWETLTFGLGILALLAEGLFVLFMAYVLGTLFYGLLLCIFAPLSRKIADRKARWCNGFKDSLPPATRRSHGIWPNLHAF